MVVSVIIGIYSWTKSKGHGGIMIILDPESQVAAQDTGRIIYNCGDKDLLLHDRNVMTCEWGDDSPDHNNLLLLAELFTGRKYPRFIDFYRTIMKDDTVYLREWEKLKDTLREKDFDYHQRLGRVRVETMTICFVNFLKMLPEKRILSLSSGLSRMMRQKTDTRLVDMNIDYSKSKNNFLEIYKQMADCPDWDSLSEMVIQSANHKGFIQNYWGRRLHMTGEPALTLVPRLTENKTNSLLGWLIHSSVHDTAIYTASYMAQILAPHGGQATLDYQCVNLSMGDAKYPADELLDLAANPDCLFSEKLEVTNG